MAAASPPQATTRPVFDPVDTAFDPTKNALRDDVESPSLASGNALARFEFEPGRSKEGTKVLMVEWEDDDTTKAIIGDWEVSWEGKRTVLPARGDQQPKSEDNETDEMPIHRLYFLLGPGVSIPTAVALRKGTVEWKTNPLPAIFAPELGATARQAGKKGVLHTIWAKKRLQVLQREIDDESKENVEGIGLEMANAEKEWIEQNFGIASKPNSISIPAHNAPYLQSPSSPRSPGGGRLLDKLKGLKLGTSSQDLSFDQQLSFHNPLSPESSDVAVGSFGSFAALKGMPASSNLAARPAQPPAAEIQKRIAAQQPPDALAALQHQHSGMGSLNAAFAAPPSNNTPASTIATIAPTATEKENEDEPQDDLFALPMSPRSPEMSKSPFSFGAQDTMRYLQGGQA
ncbi:Hypothetical protein R9X50_00396200 [Acrodontium crateriforme]|uniref:Uncharacterized protein n=1 Tax=Acrodontium crateriforme TaxID=150365 RepID=A0AAQ3MA40_9PEZI|nr:Hypothetical protein R9X50_00396200 [Acrodontium crateriforme]